MCGRKQGLETAKVLPGYVWMLFGVCTGLYLGLSIGRYYEQKKWIRKLKERGLLNGS